MLTEKTIFTLNTIVGSYSFKYSYTTNSKSLNDTSEVAITKPIKCQKYCCILVQSEFQSFSSKF